MTFWLHRFRKLDVRQKSHRKMLIDTFINAIFLYDDKMVITFNYKEGATTITFDDLKTALADQKTGSDLDCSTAPQNTSQEVAGYFLLLFSGKAGAWCAIGGENSSCISGCQKTLVGAGIARPCPFVCEITSPEKALLRQVGG